MASCKSCQVVEEDIYAMTLDDGINETQVNSLLWAHE